MSMTSPFYQRTNWRQIKRTLRIKEKFPKVMLFGGDRSLKQPPKMIALSGKGQRFVVEYRLLNGCHACERVGGAQFAFDFDADGKFLGTTLLEVQ